MMPRSIDTHKTDCKCPACRKKTGREKKRIGLVLEPELEAWLRCEAERQKKTMTAIIENGLKKLQEEKHMVEYCEVHERIHEGTQIFCVHCEQCRGDEYTGDAKTNPDDTLCLDCREAGVKE